MRTTKDNLAKFIVSETHTKNFIASENYKSQDFIQGVEYVLTHLEKIFEVGVGDETRIDIEKANFEMMAILNDLYE